jgi:hypothetical protein
MNQLTCTFPCHSRQNLHHYTSGKSNHSWHNTNCAPCLLTVSIKDGAEDREQDGSNNQICHPSTKVSPSSDNGIGCSNNLLGKHDTSPVFTHDKGCNNKPIEQSLMSLMAMIASFDKSLKKNNLLPPAIPMKRRRMMSPLASLIKPVRAVGIEEEHRMTR